MKKEICTILLVFVGTAVFGADFSLSAGAGAYLGGFFTRYTLTAEGTVEGARMKINAIQKLNQFNYGFLAFFDATYAEFSVFFQNGVNDYKETANISLFSEGSNQSGKGWESVLGFSLLGKYPFSLNERLTVFPLLGVEYQISLSQKRTQHDGFVYDRTDGLRENDKDNKAYKLEDWNSLWINLGGGVDFSLAGNFFIRGELLYGFRLMTSYETKNLDMMRAMSGDSNPKLGGITSGPALKAAAGWRFL